MRQALKHAFVASGKSQRQAAVEAPINEWRVSRIVRGWTNPTEAEKLALAEVLGRPVAELFPEDVQAG